MFAKKAAGLGLLALVLASAAGFWNACGGGAAGEQPILILISFDGFRWDYASKADTPNLDLLASGGVRAEGLVPAFPSKTFPNHYSIVTGLYPENHGIVANNMYDPETGLSFSLDDREAVEDGRWWGGEPIWVTLAKQGKRSGTVFWPGSEAPIQGLRPTYWSRFDSKLSYQDRVNRVLSWLDLPASQRPAFISLYFSAADGAGHDHGPDSPEVVEAVARLDSTLGRLMAGLKQRGLFDSVHLMVVSDHGMAASPPDQAIYLDDCVDVSQANVVDWNPMAGMFPREADLEGVYQGLKNCSPRLAVYRKEEIPERYHYRKQVRIPPLIALADEGWTITTRSFQARGNQISPGTHGYDNQLRSMWGIFVAHGPAFRPGAVLGPVQNVDLYALMARILQVAPAPNDGDLIRLQPALAN